MSGVLGNSASPLRIFDTRLHADPSRVVLRPFHLGWQSAHAPADRAERLVEDIAALSDEQADAEFALVEALIRARLNARMSQAELAKKIGTTQSAIARLEGGGVSPSIATLKRYAEATGTRLQIGLVTP